MPVVLSVNVGTAAPTAHSNLGRTGIDKLPVHTPVQVCDPGPKGVGGSGLAGDTVCDLRYHGGSDQAVYAYPREELDSWQRELGRDLRPGVFGENLTTLGLDVTGALIGERWRVGARCVLEVSAPRIPCRTFAAWLTEQRWVRRFTELALPGAYLRVVSPGPVRAGDAVAVLHRPDHDVTVGLVFRAMTSQPALLPRLHAAEATLSDTARQRLPRRTVGQSPRPRGCPRPGQATPGDPDNGNGNGNGNPESRDGRGWG